MKILFLGSTGTIGKCLKNLLIENMYDFYAPTHNECDLIDQNNGHSGLQNLEYILSDYNITDIISLSAVKTSIFLNKEKPADICYHTLQMNINLFEACKRYNKLNKILHIVSSCGYPTDIDLLRENDFFAGEVHESVRPHALSKKVIYALGKFYRQQYKLPIVACCLNNVYGNCDYDKKDTFKVLDSLIVKFVDAKLTNQPSITINGTGAARREFIYAKDAACGILEVFKKYDGDLINVGSGYDFTVKELTENFIRPLVGYKGEIIWLGGEDGQLRKCFEINRMISQLGWHPPTSLVEGIQETINNYYEYLGVEK